MSGFHGVLAGSFPAPAGGGGFPTWLSVTTSKTTSNITSHSVTLPTTAAGDLLIAMCSCDGTTAITPDAASSWTSVVGNATGTGRTQVYRLTATGSESGAVQTWATGSGEHLLTKIIRIAAGSYTGTLEGAIAAITSGNPHDPPSVSPTGGSGNYLVIAGCGLDHSSTQFISGYPYADNQNYDTTSTAAAGASLGFCSDELTGSSFDPGAFTQAGLAAQSKVFTLTLKGT